jgi:hypothetical protein
MGSANQLGFMLVAEFALKVPVASHLRLAKLAMKILMVVETASPLNAIPHVALNVLMELQP